MPMIKTLSKLPMETSEHVISKFKTRVPAKTFADPGFLYLKWLKQQYPQNL